ncbi:MAG TPA: enoyl-CoA hydratase-related protein, partial [Pseudonocardia sp.]|nr:enoyl-CoA hydratase-related protein [Pseudonocardia sp.]
MDTDFSTLDLTVQDGVAELRLNRPERANSLNRPMWGELRRAAQALDGEPLVRVVVLSGNGAHFCAGIDLGMLAEFRAGSESGGADCAGRASEQLRRTILDLQDVLSSLERCR